MTAPSSLADRVRDAIRHMHCDCYSPDDAEWAPVPCPRCRLEEALKDEGNDREF